MASVSLSFSTDAETAAGLERIEAATNRPRSWHLEQALKAYLNEQAWQLDDIRAGVAEADAGEFATDKEIEEIFASFAEPLNPQRR